MKSDIHSELTHKHIHIVPWKVNETNLIQLQPKPDQDVIDLDKLKHLGNVAGQHKDAIPPVGMGVLVMDDTNRRGQDETIPFDAQESIDNDGNTKDTQIDAGNTGDQLQTPQQKVQICILLL